METIISFSIVANIILGICLYLVSKEKKKLYNRYEELLRFCFECKKKKKAPKGRGFTQSNELDELEGEFIG